MDHDDNPCELWLSPLFVDPLIMEETAGRPYWTTGSAFDRQKCAAQDLDKISTRIRQKCAPQELDKISKGIRQKLKFQIGKNWPLQDKHFLHLKKAQTYNFKKTNPSSLPLDSVDAQVLKTQFLNFTEPKHIYVQITFKDVWQASKLR